MDNDEGIIMANVASLGAWRKATEGFPFDMTLLVRDEKDGPFKRITALLVDVENRTMILEVE
jgi:hypothetical protein